jgi:hypothetical protein
VCVYNLLEARVLSQLALLANTTNRDQITPLDVFYVAYNAIFVSLIYDVVALRQLFFSKIKVKYSSFFKIFNLLPFHGEIKMCVCVCV